MGIRESMNENPKIVTGITVAVIVLALAFIFRSYFLGDSTGGGGGGNPNQAFFSTDDGKTWFVDDIKKVAPYTKDGKDALRVYVYKCPDGTKFVGHLERYTPDAKKKLETVRGASTPPDPTILETIQISGVEVKAPGQATWVKQSDEKATAIMVPKCPKGGDPEPVLPGE